MRSKFKEYDEVVITRPVPSESIITGPTPRVGESGVILEIHDEPEGGRCLVEGGPSEEFSEQWVIELSMEDLSRHTGGDIAATPRSVEPQQKPTQAKSPAPPPSAASTAPPVKAPSSSSPSLRKRSRQRHSKKPGTHVPEFTPSVTTGRDVLRGAFFGSLAATGFSWWWAGSLEELWTGGLAGLVAGAIGGFVGGNAGEAILLILIGTGVTLAVFLNTDSAALEGILGSSFVGGSVGVLMSAVAMEWRAGRPRQ